MRFCVWLLFIACSLLAKAQQDSARLDFGDFGGIVYLDSLVVSASRTGFQVDDFIQMVRKDESFFNAFHNLRGLSYQSTNDFVFFNKKGKQKAAYHSLIQQRSDGDCRRMKVLEETHSGNFFKSRGRYRYYTAKMFDRIFLTHGKICESQVVIPERPKGIQKHVEELKKLIFQPGEPVDVPLISQKMVIFEPDIAICLILVQLATDGKVVVLGHVRFKDDHLLRNQRNVYRLTGLKNEF
ncbi:MAG: hypothetical protein AAFV25_27865, partial [Bacteroidota bacterium]